MTTLTLSTPKVALARHLTPLDRRWLKVWTMAHLVLLVVVYQLDSIDHRSFDTTIQWWDANIFQGIAAHGYWSAQSDPHAAAFFPGLPIALAFAHALVSDWAIAEMLVAFVAGAISLLGLLRLHPAAPKFLLTAPAAVFLLLGYSESLFLAFGVWAWLMAGRRRWGAAGLLTLGASLVRVNGLFLLLGLIVMAVQSYSTWSRRLPAVGRLSVALAGPVVYSGYLWLHTHDWLTWLHMEKAGWGRTLTSPLKSWRTSWVMCSYGGSYGGEEKVEIFCALTIASAVIYLAIDRDWPGVVYCGITLLTLTTSTFYMSIPRDMLTLFPIWVRLARSRETTRWSWLSVSAPIMIMIGYFYLTGQWAG